MFTLVHSGPVMHGDKILSFIMIFNTPSACGGVIPLKSGPGLALGFNTLY